MRHGLGALCALAMSLVLAPSALAVGACETIKRAAPTRSGAGIHRAPLFIGDSSMLLGVPALAQLGFQADARGCRQASAAVDILAQRRRAGTLPRLAVLGVGANGPVSRSTLARALRVMGSRRMLGLVTGAGTTNSPAALRRFARSHPTRTILIDWSATNPYRFGGDGIHIGVKGESTEARFIWRHLRPYMPPPRALKVPRTARDAEDCGVVHRREQALRVFITRGSRRIACKRAREVVRAPLIRAVSGWRSFAWRTTGHPPFTDVIARRDLRVVVAARPPMR